VLGRISPVSIRDTLEVEHSSAAATRRCDRPAAWRSCRSRYPRSAATDYRPPCPAPLLWESWSRRPATVGGGEGRAFGACCFAGKLRSPAPPTGATASPGPTAGPRPYVNGYVIVYALGVRTPACGGRGCLSSSDTPRGNGAAAPQGALRAIDPCGAAALLADLRSAPPAAAISACPGCH
jgi:hypothetical protein